MNFGPDTVKNVLKSSISNNGKIEKSLLHTSHTHTKQSSPEEAKEINEKKAFRESNEQWPSFQSQSRLRRASVWMHEKLLNKSWYINHLTIEPIQSWFYDNDDDDDDADAKPLYTFAVRFSFFFFFFFFTGTHAHTQTHTSTVSIRFVVILVRTLVGMK